MVENAHILGEFFLILSEKLPTRVQPPLESRNRLLFRTPAPDLPDEGENANCLRERSWPVDARADQNFVRSHLNGNGRVRGGFDAYFFPNSTHFESEQKGWFPYNGAKGAELLKIY